MYIKIYFDDKPLFLCDEFDQQINTLAHHDDAIFIDEFSSAAVNSMIHEMKLKKIHAGIFYHKDLEALKKAFWKKFVVIQAAGGVVQNEEDDVLMIYRRGKWDLPKGKLDKGEKLDECALREVREETGLEKVHLKKNLLITYHTYDESGKHFLKETHWYTMTAKGNQSLVPQQSEQIEEIRWVAAKDIPSLLRNSYPSIMDVLVQSGHLPS